MEHEPEILAMGVIFDALNDLGDDARERVINWVISKFEINKPHDIGKNL